MLEKQITPRILKAIRDDDRFGSGLVEIKVCKVNTLPKDALKEHQRHALEIATESTMYFKIPDLGFQNPVDAFIMKHAQSYLVIYFERYREAWALKIQDVPKENSVSLELTRSLGIRIF